MALTAGDCTVKSLRDAIKELRDQYAIRDVKTPDSILSAFNRVLEERYESEPFREFIKGSKAKGNRLTILVSHPAAIQEMEGLKKTIIKAVNDRLGENFLLDIDFRVVT